MKQKLINLQTSSYEHPFDKAALEKVNAIPMLPKIVNFVMNWTVIKWKIVSMCGSNFHVTKGACPDLAELSNEVFDILDLDRHPELYMEQDYYINAYKLFNRFINKYQRNNISKYIYVYIFIY